MSETMNWSLVPDGFVIFDLETTGLDPYEDDILEIGAIRFNKSKYQQTKQVDTFQTFVKQAKPIPKNITKINGITDEMVSGGESLYDALSEFFKFAADSDLVAYNAQFDEKFIRAHAKAVQFPLSENFRVDCALELAREYLLGIRNYKLATVADFFKVDTTGSHRASRDCVITFHVYMALTQLEKPVRVNDLEKLRQNKPVHKDFIPPSSKASFAAGRFLGNATRSLFKMIKGK